jgi:ribulose-5-phosphate 4-epimerase/fuculose-1-phosphate aldolase
MQYHMRELHRRVVYTKPSVCVTHIEWYRSWPVAYVVKTLSTWVVLIAVLTDELTSRASQEGRQRQVRVPVLTHSYAMFER